MECLRRVVEDFEQIVFVGVALRLAPPRQLDPISRRDMLHRLGEREALGHRKELEDVAARAAPAAVEESLVAIDVKRRRLFAMKRAETLVALAGELERRDLRDELHDVR